MLAMLKNGQFHNHIDNITVALSQEDIIYGFPHLNFPSTLPEKGLLERFFAIFEFFKGDWCFHAYCPCKT